EPAAVVADAGAGHLRAVALHLHVGPLGEHRVEMPRDHDRRPTARSAPLGDDVSDGVDADGEAERLEPALVLGPANGLLERRRRDLADRTLLIERPGVVGLDPVERAANGR